MRQDLALVEAALSINYSFFRFFTLAHPAHELGGQAARSRGLCAMAAPNWSARASSALVAATIQK